MEEIDCAIRQLAGDSVDEEQARKSAHQRRIDNQELQTRVREKAEPRPTPADRAQGKNVKQYTAAGPQSGTCKYNVGGMKERQLSECWWQWQ